MNTKLLHRLVWKELRTLRALWLSLLGAALVLQLWLAWWADNHHVRSEWVFTVALFLPVVYSLACAAMAFAGEREEGTDQFLCRLAAPPLALLSTKVLLNVVSTAALLVVLYPLAWILAPWYEGRGFLRAQGALATREMLALAWGMSLFSWGLFFSLLFRHVLTCLVTATVAATLTPLAVFAFLGLLPTERAKSFEALDWTLRLAVIPGLLLLVSSQFVQTWDENRWPRFMEWLLDRWRRLTVKRERSDEAARSVENRRGGWRVHVQPFGLCLPDEWLSPWRREVRRLLWLEWRQAWRVMLFVGFAFGLYLTAQGLLVASGMNLLRKEAPFVLALMAFVFGVWSFQAQQSEKRFRGLAGHGVSPTAIWIVKQGVWFGAMFLMAVLITLVITLWFSPVQPQTSRTIFQPLAMLGYGYQWNNISGGVGSEWLLESFVNLCVNAAFSLGLCYAVGQCASLLIPRAVTAALVGFVLAGVAFGGQQLTAHLAIPSGLAVLPFIIGLLLASFVRMSDWMEERNTIRSWLKVVMACLVPSLVALIGVPMYRVWEIPEPDHEWRIWLTAMAAPPSPSARQTAADWLRVANSIEGDPSLHWKQRGKSNEGDEEVEIEVNRESAELSDLRDGHATWANLRNREWVTGHAQQLAEAKRLAQEPNCAFTRPIFERTVWSDARGSQSFRSLVRLAMLLSMAAESEMAEGRLDAALDQILVLHRFTQHLRMHGGFEALLECVPLELHAWSLLRVWASHPQQTGDSLRAALDRSGASPLLPLRKPQGHDQPFGMRVFDVMYSDYAAAKLDLNRRWEDASWLTACIFSERRREERFLDYSATESAIALRQYFYGYQNDADGTSRFIQIPPEPPNGLRTLLRSTTRTSPFHWEHHYHTERAVNQFGQLELRRRALLTTLALRAFRLDHGHWPNRWEELVGNYLGGVPVDPWTGFPFDYWPNGFPFDLKVDGRKIAANTPLFLSGGPLQQTFKPRVRPWKEGEPPQFRWWLYSKWGNSAWPPERDDYTLNSIVCFPLDATAP